MSAEIAYRRGQPPVLGQRGTCDSCGRRSRRLVLVTLAGEHVASRAFFVCRYCALVIERP